MIKNDRRYQITKSRLSDFKESLSELEKKEMDPLLKELHTGALKSQIIEFEKQISEYELLKEGVTNYLFINNLSGIPEALIKARINNRLTQAELAEKLELKEQQIQRYEISDYSAASISRITEIANALGLQFEKIKIKIKETILSIPEGIDERKFSQARNQKSLLKL